MTTSLVNVVNPKGHSAMMTPESIVAAAAANGLTADEVARVLAALKGTIHRFIDPSATVHPTAKVWHYAVVLQDVFIGADVSVGAHAEIGRGSRIGAGTRIGSGVFLPPDTIIGERVFIGPHVAMSDDKHPRVPYPSSEPYHAQPPVIGDDVAIGLGAVLLPGVTIGHGARIGAGAIVTKDVPAGGFVRGEPAREKPISPEAQAWFAEICGPSLRVTPLT